MNKGLRLAIAIVLAASVGGIAYLIFQRESAKLGPLTASGTIEATDVEVSAQTAAKITSIGATEGQKVKKEKVIAYLDRRLLLDQARQAKDGVSAARAAVRATKSDGTSADVAAAKAQFRQAKVTYRMALVQLSYATIKSPLSGVVLSVPVNTGETAMPGTVLAVVADLRTVHVHVFVPEAQLGLIKLGQPAKFSTDANRSYAGKVSRIASEAEFTPSNIETKEQRVKQVFQVTIALPNPEGELKPGMPGDVTFE